MIRLLKSDEVPTILEWWKKHNEVAPTEEMLPLDSTFVFEREAELQLCVTLYLTNANIAWVDNFVRNPEVKGMSGFKDTVELLQALNDFAKEKGKSVLFCMSQKKSTDRRYEQLGFMNTAREISTFIKGVN